MKPWMENSVGRVAFRLPRSGCAAKALALPMICAEVPPPNLWLTALRWARNPCLEPTISTTNATRVPTIAMMKAPFCQRNVVLVPRIRMRVCSTTMASDAIRIQVVFVWNEFPQLTNEALLASTPNATRAGPSANTEKNLAKNAAPNSPPKIIATLEISDSGGDSTRLTQT
jgi:hypothetical protein